GFHHAVQLDVGLDELDGAIRAGGHGLRGCAGEPVDDRATADQPKNERSMQQREVADVLGEAVGQRHDDGEDHRGSAYNSRSDHPRLGRRFERIARAVIGFQQVLGALEVHVEVEVALNLRLDVGDLLDQRQLVDRLRVVGNGAVGVDGDGYWTHAEE